MEVTMAVGTVMSTVTPLPALIKVVDMEEAMGKRIAARIPAHTMACRGRVRGVSSTLLRRNARGKAANSRTSSDPKKLWSDLVCAVANTTDTGRRASGARREAERRGCMPGRKSRKRESGSA